MWMKNSASEVVQAYAQVLGVPIILFMCNRLLCRWKISFPRRIFVFLLLPSRNIKQKDNNLFGKRLWLMMKVFAENVLQLFKIKRFDEIFITAGNTRGISVVRSGTTRKQDYRHAADLP